jgi:hypothetical protein
MVCIWSVSCSQAAAPPKQEKGAPATDQGLAALFGKDSNLTALRVPAGEGAANVCVAGPDLWSFYPGAGIKAVTGSVPFLPTSEPSGSCHVRITSRPEKGRDLFVSSSCKVRALADGTADIVVAPAEKDRFAATECFYRLALVLEGYTGGFTAPVFGEYPDSFYFAGKRSYVGPLVTTRVQYLIRKCTDLVGKYYSRDMREFARSKCGVSELGE